MPFNPRDIMPYGRKRYSGSQRPQRVGLPSMSRSTQPLSLICEAIFAMCLAARGFSGPRAARSWNRLTEYMCAFTSSLDVSPFQNQSPSAVGYHLAGSPPEPREDRCPLSPLTDQTARAIKPGLVVMSSSHTMALKASTASARAFSSPVAAYLKVMAARYWAG